MLKIAVCDDDIKITETIESYIARLCAKLSFQYELYRFDDGQKLVENYPKNLDICFLDVQMEKLDGISAAREIRKEDEKVILVFMSNYAKYALDGFSVHAYQYLLKPVEYVSFEQEMENVFIRCEKSHFNHLFIKNDDGLFDIDERDILYIETYVSKNSLIHTRKGNIVAYASLKELQERLNNDRLFKRCHNSYIISLSFISSIQKEYIVLNNNENIPLSRHRRKEMLDAYMIYMGELL
ncbi:MAG: LytR/AlgR family response regulator transcription factor [Erysipelotrichaceae bacterium]